MDDGTRQAREQLHSRTCKSTAAALPGALGMRAIALAASAWDIRCSISRRLEPRSSQAQSRELMREAEDGEQGGPVNAHGRGGSEA